MERPHRPPAGPPGASAQASTAAAGRDSQAARTNSGPRCGAPPARQVRAAADRRLAGAGGHGAARPAAALLGKADARRAALRVGRDPALLVGTWTLRARAR